MAHPLPQTGMETNAEIERMAQIQTFIRFGRTAKEFIIPVPNKLSLVTTREHAQEAVRNISRRFGNADMLDWPEDQDRGYVNVTPVIARLGVIIGQLSTVENVPLNPGAKDWRERETYNTGLRNHEALEALKELLTDPHRLTPENLKDDIDNIGSLSDTMRDHLKRNIDDFMDCVALTPLPSFTCAPTIPGMYAHAMQEYIDTAEQLLAPALEKGQSR